jgi:hypothetical protein
MAGPQRRLSVHFLEHELFMKKLLIAAVALCLPVILVGQDQTVQDYTRVLKSEDLPLNITHLNDKTVPLLFKAPILYSMRARAKEATTLYVQAVVEMNAELDTTNFELEQEGMNYPGTPSSIANFTKGKIKLKLGDQVAGVLTFPKLIDVSKPFALKHGRDRVDFRFTGDQIKALAAPAPAN